MLRFIYGGYDAVHAHPYEMLRQTGVPDYTLLLVKSPAYFYLNGIRTETEPQTAVLFPPHAPVRYGSVGTPYKDDWLHFVAEGEEELLGELNLPVQTPLALPDLPSLSDVCVFW